MHFQIERIKLHAHTSFSFDEKTKRKSVYLTYHFLDYIIIINSSSTNRIILYIFYKKKKKLFFTNEHKNNSHILICLAQSPH